MNKTDYDAVVVGAGPNGLSAAIVLASAGLSVLVMEAAATPGGSCRTAELTLPGFHHDVCAAIHPMGSLSPAFREFNLENFGLKWVPPLDPVAHVLDDRAILLHGSLGKTAEGLGEDGDAWRKLFDPFVERKGDFFNEVLRPVRIPSKPVLMARFGLSALRSCAALLDSRFHGDAARALFAGCAAHSVMPLDAPGTASFGLVLAIAAHASGWPFSQGGSGQIISALEKCFLARGGEIRCDHPVRTLSDIPDSHVVLFDLTPRQIVAIAGTALHPGYVRALERFRYGMGTFKIDWALDGPIPWRDPNCSRAAMVHVGGIANEVMRSESQAAAGSVSERPFVLVAQQSLFDPCRAPAGKHTGWAYCHVPANWTGNMTDRIEAQVERFAPGFRDRILARHTRTPSQHEEYNANLVGGDISGGANNLSQFLFRPVARYDPYSTPNRRLFICSSSTPPGGGVHGMCGYWAARSALKREFGISSSPS